MNSVHRVHPLYEAGGKGVNVTKLLAQIGEKVAGVAPISGLVRDFFHAQLSRENLSYRFVKISDATRQTVCVKDADGRATMFNEAGPDITEVEWLEIEDSFLDQVATNDVLVISGSVPKNVPPQTFSSLIKAALSAGAKVLIDTSGPYLQAAATAGATLLKPNESELEEATGKGDVRSGMIDLLNLGARFVCASRGVKGMSIGWKNSATDYQFYSAWLDQSVTGNPTGAGDALVAMLAKSLHEATDTKRFKKDVATVLEHATAFSAATLPMKTAGSIDGDAYRSFLGHVTIKEGIR